MSELEQLRPFVECLRQLRSLQGQFQRSASNPARREELVPKIRDARALADNTAELLRAVLETTVEGDTQYAAQLFVTWQKVREAHREAFATKRQTAYETLRRYESALDKMLRAYKPNSFITKSA